MSYAICFNLDQSKIMSYGNGLMLSIWRSSTLAQMTNIRLFQAQRVCRQQFQTWWKGKKILLQVENTMGQGEIDHNKQFLLFPQCFQKTFGKKNRACLGKG